MFGNLLEDELLLDEFGNRRGRGNDFVSDMFQVDAVADLMGGNVDGFVEDELLADIF
jgi:hypothetical protein